MRDLKGEQEIKALTLLGTFHRLFLRESVVYGYKRKRT